MPAPTIPLDAAQPVKAQCWNQGVYIGETAKVLPYDSAIEIDGFRCESSTENIACHQLGSQRGFTIAREGIEVSN